MATAAVPKPKISGGSFLLEERTPEEVFTPEDFTEQHQLIGQTAEEFATNEIVPNIEKMEHKDFSVTRELLKKAGELGLSGVEIPEGMPGLRRPGADTPALARCRSFISERKSRRKDTCLGWLPGKLSALMRYRRRLQVQTL